MHILRAVFFVAMKFHIVNSQCWNSNCHKYQPQDQV